MRFRYDIDKAIAASAYLIQKAGGSYNILHLVKALYCANRRSFVQFGRSITGDRLVSMPAGPVVSNTYDLANGSSRAKEGDLARWREVISKRQGHALKLVGTPDFDYLSARETEILDQAFAEISSVKEPLKKWSHKVFPEWIDPGTGSVEIDPRDILVAEKRSPEEISDIAEEVESINWLKSIAT